MMPPIVSFFNNKTQQHERHDLEQFQSFLDFHIDKKALPIGKYLAQIRSQPVFIVAATGVGKTVAVPMHLFIERCKTLSASGQTLTPLPHIYVIEPTIPICTREMEHMNESYHRFMAECGDKSPESNNPFGAITGPTGRVNGDAPILFITTGVFERIARDSRLQTSRTRFIIDEAHRTLTQSDGVEIAIAIAKKKGAAIDFMSATVDTGSIREDLNADVISATEQRFPIVLKTTRRSMASCIGDLTVKCLLKPDESVVPPPESFAREEDKQRASRVKLHLLSRHAFKDPYDGRPYPGITERPQGMLVIVNSHHGEQSDTRRMSERIREALSKESAQVEVLRLASSVIRDREQEESFSRRIDGIESRNGRYVIVATNVIEMGVTFPSLDYVVTMDTELETVDQFGGEIIREVPLSVNGLFQRIGRVGRSRPGMAFITREETENDENAVYSLWDENQLSANLKLEPIEYAIRRGKTGELAFFLLESSVPLGREEAKAFLSTLPLPSAPHKDSKILNSLESQRLHVKKVGLSDNGQSLNELGRKYRDIAVVKDLHLGKLLASCCIDDKARNLRYLSLVAAACESKPFRDILGRRTHLEDASHLNLSVPFAKDEFNKPLLDVWESLRQISETHKSNTLEIGASEQSAHHILELLKDGFVPEKPSAPPESGAGNAPIVLFLSKPVIQLDPRSEIISSYNIVAYFFNKYRPELRNPIYDEFEVARVRRALRTECLEIGVNPFAVESIISRIGEVARHANIKHYSKADTTNIVSQDAIKSALKLQLLIDAGTGQVKQEALQSLLDHVENGTELEKASYEFVKNQQRQVVKRLREFQPSRGSEYLPALSENEKCDFIDLVQRLSIFEPASLQKETDHRGVEKFVGTSRSEGQTIKVEMESQRTSIRPNGLHFHVRGKVSPLPYRDDDGNEQVRYILTHVTLIN